MFALPSMNANAQAAGTIAGVPVATAGIVAALIVGVALVSNDSDGRTDPVAPAPTNTSTTTTTSTTSTSSTSTTSSSGS